MILKHWQGGNDIEVKTPKELKEFLMMCNPSMLKVYKEQVHQQRPDIKVDGCGVGLKLLRRETNESK